MSKHIKFEILKCANCGNTKLIQNIDYIQCSKCKTIYNTIKNKILMSYLISEDIVDSLDKFKYLLKRYYKLYQLLVTIISPVYVGSELKKFIKKYVQKDENFISVNLGSGNSNISSYVSNIDIFAYDNVDMTCDIGNIPIKDNSVDVIINQAVLEHVPDPQKVVSEIHRILKPGGVVYCAIPFIQGFHASPYDFTRYTFEGMKLLFKDFEMIELKPVGGPTSGFLWVLQEWLAILFSFGFKPLHSIFFLIFMILTFPLKYLDIILLHFHGAKNISSAFLFIGKKVE